jgi:hypothetical protein
MKNHEKSLKYFDDIVNHFCTLSHLVIKIVFQNMN